MSEFEPASRFAPAPHPQVRLVAHPAAPEARQWEGRAAELVAAASIRDKAAGIWKVQGVAGSGVTSLVTDAVMARLEAGVPAASVCVIAASKESGGRLRRVLAERAATLEYVSEGSLVRSVHSFAFAIVRAAALRSEKPAPRLITGAEQDAVIRELLLGHVADSSAVWPLEQREALRMVGFARQLRDFLLRAVERGAGPEDLEQLGGQYGRPLWVSAGKFLREYEQTMALSGAHSLNASELVTVALEALAADPGLLEQLRRQWGTVVVDDAQHLDPQSARLLALFFDSAQFGIIAGDAEQSVFRFRGASPEFLTSYPADHEVVLPHSRRKPQSTRIVLAPNPSEQLRVVANAMRRAHLLDGVAWSEMAVIVRSAQSLAPVRRALLAADVPVHVDPTDVVLAEQRIVASMILGVRALSHTLSIPELEELVLGPIGGADPVTLRRLYRGLRQAELAAQGSRRAVEVLGQLVLPATRAQRDPQEWQAEYDAATSRLTDREKDVLERVRMVLDAGYQARAAGESVEMVLWRLWEATGLSERLMAASLRGGAAGSQADRDLDAMMSLFDAAGDYVERRPTASVDSFIRHISEQQLPTGSRDRRGVLPDAVHVLTAHAALGQEWDTVVVAGVQEGTWPSLGETGTLFGQEELVDVLDVGIDPNLPISRSTERLAEERRLFRVATSRATRTLLITAVDAPEADDAFEVSRFVEEYAAAHGLHCSFVEPQDADESQDESQDDVFDAQMERHDRHLLSASAMVAELRRVVCDAHERSLRREQAARQLARLAQAGVPGADPAQWWGVQGASTSAVLQQEDRVTLSPSRIEKIAACPLRAVLDGVVDESETPIHMVKGTLVHAFAEAIARGADSDAASMLVYEAYAGLVNAPAWQRESTLRAWDMLIDNTELWLLNSRGLYSEVGVEMGVDVAVGRTEQGQTLRIKGRMDRLERNNEGEFVVVDLKTGNTPPPKKSMGEHAQLSAYQLALSRGVLAGDWVNDAPANDPGLQVGGGVLVYPSQKIPGKVDTREQVAKTAEELEELAARLPKLAAAVRGPALEAIPNETCENCVIVSLCPAKPAGRMLTDAE